MNNRNAVEQFNDVLENFTSSVAEHMYVYPS